MVMCVCVCACACVCAVCVVNAVNGETAVRECVSV